MRKRGFGILISFPAKSNVAIKAEAVVKTSRLGFGFLHKSLTESLHFLYLAAADLEIWCDADGVILSGHHSPPYDFSERSIILPFTAVPAIVKRATVIGNRNRRGPALPGLRNNTPSRLSING